MILSVKEHERHHPGQLMLIERVFGITPDAGTHGGHSAEIRSAGLIVAADSQIDPAIWQYELKQNSTGDGVV